VAFPILGGDAPGGALVVFEFVEAGALVVLGELKPDFYDENAVGGELVLEARDAAQATLAARGMQVIQPTPSVMEGLSRISQTIAQEWATRAGEDGARLLAAYRA
jgi:H2-forming N5,N10-methylenetetrahydromethanopterin dehydrogenase-like enzyme